MDLKSLLRQTDRHIKHISIWMVLWLYGAGLIMTVVTSINRLPTDTYYHDWAREYSFFTFSSSLQYFMAGQAAFICFWIMRYHQKRTTRRKYRPWLWMAAAAAFTYATFDELFEIHERALGALDRAVPWLSRFYFNVADDLFVISCAIGALIFTIFMIRQMWPVRAARNFYFLALFLLVLAGLLDYLPQESFQFKLPLGLEELAEYFSGTSFAIAFLIFAMDRFRLILADWLFPTECVITQKETSSSEPAKSTQS